MSSLGQECLLFEKDIEESLEWARILSILIMLALVLIGIAIRWAMGAL